MKEALIAFLVAMVIGAAVNGWTGSNAPPPPASEQSQNKAEASPGASADTFPSTLPQTTDVAFDTDVLKSEQPVLVDFYADWCGPCKKMAPVVDKLANQYTGKMKFYRINTDENPSVTNRYGVTSIPTFMVFSKGQRGETFNGEVPEELLSTALNKATQ